MEKEKFSHNFTSAIAFLIDFTKQYCFNELSKNYKFIITPNSRNVSDHLNVEEKNKLEQLNKFQNRLLSQSEATDLLFQKGKVPLWINIAVRESKPDITVIDLFCSRRFRTEDELNHVADQYPPFHPLVPVPPDSLRIEQDGKYNINYQKRLNTLRKRKGVLNKLIRLFKG